MLLFENALVLQFCLYLVYKWDLALQSSHSSKHKEDKLSSVRLVRGQEYHRVGAGQTEVMWRNAEPIYYFTIINIVAKITEALVEGLQYFS